MSTLAKRLGQMLLIVPAAHYRIFDVRLQIELYELFHRKTLCRVGHALCTPIVLLGMYLLLGRVHAPVSLLYALSLALFLVALRVDVLVGILMLAPLAALHNLATSVLAARAPILPLGLTLVLGGALVQTLSHTVEDVPPPTSGTAQFMPVGRWLRTAGLPRLVGSMLLCCSVYTLLELWASTRIWPLQLLHAMMRLGYRPGLRRLVDRRVLTLAADPQGALSRIGASASR